MPIAGKPLLSIWLDRLTEANFGPFLINGHHKFERILEFINYNKHRDIIQFSYEEEMLGTAGTLIKNIDFIKDGGLILHADNYCLANFNEFYKYHQKRPKSCLMTMMTYKTSTPSLRGIVKLDKNNIVTKFYEKDDRELGNIANGAIYLISKEMVNELKNNFSKCRDFSTEIIPAFLNRIYTYFTDQPLIDIGNIDDYNKALSISKNT